MNYKTSADIAAVMAADDARYAAMLAGDVAALDSLLADSLVYTHATARTEDKAAYLKAVSSGVVKYVELERSEVVVQVYGSTAVMHGRLSLSVLREGSRKGMTGLFQSVWVRLDNRWQMVAWASVPQAFTSA